VEFIKAFDDEVYAYIVTILVQNVVQFSTNYFLLKNSSGVDPGGHVPPILLQLHPQLLFLAAKIRNILIEQSLILIKQSPTLTEFC